MLNFEDLAFLFTCDNRNRGLLRMNFDEAAVLWKAVKYSGGDILEIGRNMGGSLALIEAAKHEGRHVVSVDLFDKVEERVKHWIAPDTEVLIQNSREPIPATWGLILFDGDHSAEGIWADLKAHWNNLENGGLAAFHDACSNQGLKWQTVHSLNYCAGVQQAVTKLEGLRIAEHIDNAGSMVVLRKLGALPEES